MGVLTQIPDFVEIAIQTDRCLYPAGDPITLQLRATNRGSQTVKLGFSSSQLYDFVIYQAEQEMWRWSHDRMFAMVLSTLALQPQQSIVYEESWDQTDNQGNVVEPGKYRVTGGLTIGTENALSSTTIEIATG